MSKSTSVGTVRIKRNCTPLLKENLDRISVLFSAHLHENEDDGGRRPSKEECFAVFDVCTGPLSADRTHSPDFIARLQIIFRVTIMFGSSSVYGSSTNQNPFAPNLTSGQSNPFGSTNTTNFQTPSPFGTQHKFPSFGGASNNPNYSFGQSPFSTTNTNAGFNSFTGTIVKYAPLQDTESSLKNGISSLNRIRLCSITCMNEYLDKSFEELRYEDYSANRKGGFFGSVDKNSNSAASGLFCIADNKNNNNLTTPSLFKSGFSWTPPVGMNAFSGGNNNTSSFLTSNNAIFTNNNSSSKFSSLLQKSAQETKPFAPFGHSQNNPFGTTNSLFGNQTSSPLFGSQPVNSQFSNQTSPQFGATTTSPFGINPTNTSFGLSSTNNPFGGNTQTTNAPFGIKPTNTQNFNMPFGVQPINTQTTNTLFGTQAKNAPFGVQSTNTPFGVQPINAQSTNAPFGVQPNNGQTNSPFGLQPNALFAHNDPLANSTQINNQTMINANQQPSLNMRSDNSPLLGGNQLYATPPKTFSFNTNPLNVTNYATQTLNTSSFELKSPPGIETLREMLSQSSPYGYSPIFKDLRVVDANDVIRANQETLSRIQRELIPPPKPKVKEMNCLFNSLNDNDESKDFIMRRNVRQLRIKPIVPPPEPLVVDNIIAKKDDDFTTKSIDTTERRVSLPMIAGPGSSDSPFILNEGKQLDESNEDSTAGIIPHCGVILTKPDYYTLPPLQDLPNFSNADGSCLVKGFTIGRLGFGNVHFFDTIDVSNLDLDNIVDIGFREITVYPDDDNKPPFGQGLNRRAQVTLDGVYPRREDGEFETDLDTLKERKYENTLRIVSVRMDVDFVEYRPETGSWVFIAPHFSKYIVEDSF